MRRAAGDNGVGASPAGPVAVVAMGVVFAVVTVAGIVTLIAAWPAPVADPAAAVGPEKLRLLGATLTLDADQRLFVVVACAGALGAMVHVLRSFTWYVGNRRFVRSWLAQYLLLPLVGAALGLIVYVVLRGGLLSSQGSSSDVSPYGVAGLAALVGLFSEQAIEKLKQVFETLLAPAQQGRDHAAAKPSAITAVSPAAGAVGAMVTISGNGLAGATAVDFAGAAAEFTVASDNEITTAVPAGATSGPIAVHTPSGVVASPSAFAVETSDGT